MLGQTFAPPGCVYDPGTADSCPMRHFVVTKKVTKMIDNQRDRKPLKIWAGEMIHGGSVR